MAAPDRLMASKFRSISQVVVEQKSGALRLRVAAPAGTSGTVCAPMALPSTVALNGHAMTPRVEPGSQSCVRQSRRKWGASYCFDGLKFASYEFIDEA